jgi:hypothetical protein
VRVLAPLLPLLPPLPLLPRYVHPDNVLHVLQQLRRPWGFGGEGTEEMLRKRLLALQLPLYKEGLFYYDVFLGLTTSVMIKSARAHGTILKVSRECGGVPSVRAPNPFRAGRQPQIAGAG